MIKWHGYVYSGHGFTIQQLNGRIPKKALRNVEPAISVPTLNEINDVAITDCKSLYDLITRTAPPSCSEFHVRLVARAVKEARHEGISVRWVHTGAQLADCSTKAMQCHFLGETLRLGAYQLHDETATLKDRAQTRDRIKWLQRPTIKPAQPSSAEAEV